MWQQRTCVCTAAADDLYACQYVVVTAQRPYSAAGAVHLSVAYILPYSSWHLEVWCCHRQVAIADCNGDGDGDGDVSVLSPHM
jgi:hypothetical protein